MKIQPVFLDDHPQGPFGAGAEDGLPKLRVGHRPERDIIRTGPEITPERCPPSRAFDGIRLGVPFGKWEIPPVDERASGRHRLDAHDVLGIERLPDEDNRRIFARDLDG